MYLTISLISIGPYAFLLPGPNTKGTWISYESPEYAAAKGTYAKSKGLGGVAISDVTLDDYRGSCSFEKFPILKAALTSLVSPY